MTWGLGFKDFIKKCHPEAIEARQHTRHWWDLSCHPEAIAEGSQENQPRPRISKFAKLTKKFNPRPQWMGIRPVNEAHRSHTPHSTPFTHAIHSKKLLVPYCLSNLVSFKKAAFTLAEVLITLAIIGIVAAMTIPTLIADQQNKALQAQLKKAYSEINQALKLYQAENGIPLTSNNIGIKELKENIMPYFKVAIDCGFGINEEDACVKNYDNGEGTSSDDYKTLTGNEIDLYKFDDGQFVLNDGTLILIENGAPPTDLRPIYISCDVNGLANKPNRLGKDLFMFQINDKGILLPMGAEGTDYYDENDAWCSSTSTENLNGAGCTYKALYDKDYFKNLPK